MKKDFDSWNKKKKEINTKRDVPKFYHPREIWWCSLGVNIGSESDGKGDDFGRPVLILKGFNRDSFLGIALTGKKREGKYYIYLGKIKDRDASVNLSQIRLLDTKRLVNRLGMLEESKFKKIKKAVKAFL